MENKARYTELLTMAKEARGCAYAPYSGFTVGAALLCEDGRIYTGANQESSAFSPSLCAERVAFARAIMDGERHFVAIAVAGGRTDDGGDEPCPPCGVCRQVMAEFVTDGFMIILAEGDGYAAIPFSDILPYSFGKEKLK